MADNYLERKMEEYRAGRRVTAPRRITPSGQKAGTVTLPIDRLDIFVTSADGPLVTAFANTGCKVSFCGDDRRAGMLMAERTGARFYPYPAGEALSRAARPDVVATRKDDTTVTLTFASGKMLTVHADCNVELLAAVMCSSQFAALTDARCTVAEIQ